MTSFFRLLFSLNARRGQQRPSGRSALEARLEVEPLEDRVLLSAPTPGTALKKGALVVIGGAGNDTIEIARDGANLKVKVNDVETGVFDAAFVRRININAGRGNDRIVIDPAVTTPAQIHGGLGDDIIVGGSGNDQLKGELGNDLMLGGQGNDKMHGGVGNDRMDGGQGNDVLDGGPGLDILFGGQGNDTIKGSLDPNFSNDHQGFSFRDPSLLGVRVFELPGAPDIDNPTTASEHRDGVIDYTGYGNPPTYGPHHSIPSVAPVPTGFYDIPKADEDIVHNLEHGHAWLSYDPDLFDAGHLADLNELLSLFGPGDGILLTPRLANDNDDLTLVSWGHVLTLDEFDAEMIVAFLFANRGHGPEGFATP